jgi:hypothetical protein
VMNIYYLFCWNFLISAVMYMLEVNLFFILFLCLWLSHAWKEL